MSVTNLATVPRRRGRPPRTEAREPDARAQLLREGVATLTERGFSALGLDDLLSATGVSKGAFYHYFGSKSEFGLALIDAYAAYFARKLDRWFLDETLSPLSRLQAFMDDARHGMERYGYRRGCLVGNLGQEVANLPETFRDRLGAVFADWEERTTRCLEEAKVLGQIAPDSDCAALATFFWIGWEGAVLRAKLERTSQPLKQFSQGFLGLLTRR